MPIIASDKGGDRKKVPEGTHQAVCYGIVDIGTQPSDKFDPRRQVLIQWELPEERVQYINEQGVEEDRSQVLSKRFTLSLHKRASLRQALESWRGRAFTEDELKGFDLVKVLGKNCFVSVVHSDDGKYANIQSVSALPKKIAAIDPERPTLYFTLDDVPEGLDECPFPDNMPDWLKGLVLQSKEYGERFGSGWSDAGAAQDDLDDSEIPF